MKITIILIWFYLFNKPYYEQQTHWKLTQMYMRSGNTIEQIQKRKFIKVDNAYRTKDKYLQYRWDSEQHEHIKLNIIETEVKK